MSDENGKSEPAEAVGADMAGRAGGHADPRFQDAVAALQRGQLPDAERRTREILKDNDRDPLAVHLLGVIAHQAGKSDIAVELVRKAIEIDPEAPAFRNTLGFMLRLAKKHDEAIESLAKAVELKPDYAEARNNLGIALSEAGRTDEAVKAYEEALAANPNFPEVLNNLGNILARSGRLEDALARYEQALEQRPDYAEAWSNRGDATLALDRSKREEAAGYYRKAVEANPRWSDAWVKLGTTCHALDRLDEAEAALRKALRLNPNNVRCLTAIAATLEKRGNLTAAASHLRHALTVSPDDVASLKALGHITLKLGNAVEAKHVLARARELMPADPDTLYSYANCLLRMEQLQPAMDLYLRVRELQPKQARGTFAPAAVLLMDGQYEKGWAAYESRYDMTAFKPNVPNIRERLWDGSPLNGRRLLVHVEQGFGDTIQFCRYLPKIRERMGSGGSVAFLCEPELYRLMGTLPGVDDLYHIRQRDVQIVYDLQIPLLSLPHRFGTTVETVPKDIPYLGVPDATASQAPLPASGKALVKAGFVWTGRPTHSDNLYRSIPLAQLAELFDIDGVDFHSLQIGNGVSDLKAYTGRDNVFDHSGRIKDFADTAAILSQLDVLISVDTAVCHLAGALGKDVWTMVPFGGEWRWLRNREDTPWYPSMRLVRQRVLGDWGMVIDRVREGLEGAVASRREKGLSPGAAVKTSPSEEHVASPDGVEAKVAGKKSKARKSPAKKARSRKKPAKTT